jgi:hypothetical protein
MQRAKVIFHLFTLPSLGTEAKSILNSTSSAQSAPALLSPVGRKGPLVFGDILSVRRNFNSNTAVSHLPDLPFERCYEALFRRAGRVGGGHSLSID